MQKLYASYLKFRQVPIDVSALEAHYNLEVQPIYRSFIETFESIYVDEFKDVDVFINYGEEFWRVKNE